MQRIAGAEMAALHVVFEHKVVVVACAAVLNTLLAGCKQVVAAFLKRLQMIAIRDSIRLQGGNQIDYKQAFLNS